jgi:tetratricopeptide (TPR) repeat protein
MANFEFWQYRYRDDYRAFARAHEGYRRAIELDPSSAYAHFSFARAVAWNEPELAVQLFERSAELDPLYDLSRARSAVLMSLTRGLHETARKRLEELSARSLFGISAQRADLARALGRLDEAVTLFPVGEPARWSLYMSLGDREAAREALRAFRDRGGQPGEKAGPDRGDDLAEAVYQAASLSMEARFGEAYEALERRRTDFPLSRVLDLPTARFALIAGHAEHAREILEQRLPDLVSGLDSVNGLNVIPALDLATAYAGTGRRAEAAELLQRIGAFLDGADAPRWPLFVYLRARAHALASEREQALRALDRAYDGGFRMTWGVDVGPGLLLYTDPIDADPAFAALRQDPRFKSWRRRIGEDNARQLESLRARASGVPASSS